MLDRHILEHKELGLELAVAKALLAATNIATSVAAAGDFATKASFVASGSNPSLITVPEALDYTNHRLNILRNYRYCRIGFALGWTADAVGWRGASIRDSAGNEFLTERVANVGAAASTNHGRWTAWLAIATAAVAHHSVLKGDWVALYPAHNATTTPLSTSAVDSWFAIEFCNSLPLR